MNINKIQWIWQQPHWPQFNWDMPVLQPIIQQIQYKQGLLLGKISVPNAQFSLEATLDTLVQNIVTSSAIEGEYPNAASVRASLAKRLGMVEQQMHAPSKRSEGLAAITLDSIQNIKEPLKLERLFQWHRWLFPEETFSVHSTQVGRLRGEEPMQIVSGRMDKPTIHYEAPPRERLESEMKLFIEWFNQSQEGMLDPFIRAAICHLWFEVIHPFEDGNGRIGRALTDLTLAQANGESIHFYTMSVSILQHRKIYYQALENSKSLEITPWIKWFLNTLDDSIQNAIDHIDRTLVKTKFWQNHSKTILSDEQSKILNKLLEDSENNFPQGINATQYQKIAKVSKATATRHLTDLLQKGCIEKLLSGGRSTRYKIVNSEDAVKRKEH